MRMKVLLCTDIVNSKILSYKHEAHIILPPSVGKKRQMCVGVNNGELY